MHTYRRNKGEQLWTVGFWEPGSLEQYNERGVVVPRWNALQDCRDEDQARRLVNYLNGGDGVHNAGLPR